MPEYLSPGVYVEEIEIGAKPIEGVGTTTAGFLGETERGPVEPRLVTGMEQFRRLYGAYGWKTGDAPSNSTLPYAIDGFFTNGGKRCFIGRIVSAGARTATGSPPTDGASEKDQKDAADASQKAEEEVKRLKEKLKEDNKAAADNPDDAAASRAASNTADSLKAAQDALKKAKDFEKGLQPSAEPPFTISAIGPGRWGNRISFEIGPAALSDRVHSRFKMSVFYENDQNVRVLQEDYDGLSPLPDSPQFYERRINNESSLITIKQRSPHDTSRPKNTSSVNLDGGSDGQEPTIDEYEGVSDQPGGRRGLGAFVEIDEISILCAPDEDRVPGLKDALVSHCENLKDRFAILQPPSGVAPIRDLEPKKTSGAPIDSKYAAFYAPQITVRDRITGGARNIPPGGHIAGIYARTDIERGVHKAPANEVVRGAVGVQVKYTTGEQDILNPRGVNCIRVFPGRGIRVWGARTISSDPAWKYVNVRRLFIFVEESIEQGTQWVVFEPNNERLWARVRQSVADFLTGVWRSGALMGLTADEAFFVKCDETTMTQNDIDNGRLIVVVGMAPVKPAEFVIFRIAQWTQGSEVTV